MTEPRLVHPTALDDPALDDPALDPAATLALVEDQRRAVTAAIEVDARVLYGTWGAAWLVGFGAFWLTAGGPSGVYQRPPLWTGLLFFGCIVGAVVVTAVHTARASGGIRGDSAEVGAMYGWSWCLGFAAFAALFVGLVRSGASDEVLALVSPSASCLLVGVLYLAGGAVWRDRVQYGLGVWILVVTAAGTLVGLPGIYLVMALAGGGGSLVAAAWFAVRRR